MKLSDLIIEHGPWNDSGRIMGTADMADLNELREELMAARAAAAIPAGFSVEAIGLADGDQQIWINHKRCPESWHAELDELVTLAALVQRAGEHAEVCRG